MALPGGPSLVASPRLGATTRVVPVRRSWLPGGDAGILMTVAEMRRLANRAAPSIRAIAQQAAGGATDATDQWHNLRDWLTIHTQFTPDPDDTELVRTPIEQLTRIAQSGVMRGDCDDVATLAAALTKALGRRARYVVLGFIEPGPATPYRHVYAEMLTAPDVWRDFDVTRRKSSLPASRRQTVEV